MSSIKPRNRSRSKVTSSWLGFDSWQGACIFYGSIQLQSVSPGLERPQREVDHCPLVLRLNNIWRITFTPPCVFMTYFLGTGATFRLTVTNAVFLYRNTAPCPNLLCLLVALPSCRLLSPFYLGTEFVVMFGTGHTNMSGVLGCLS
jgi:hypothetical protein